MSVSIPAIKDASDLHLVKGPEAILEALGEAKPMVAPKKARKVASVMEVEAYFESGKGGYWIPDEHGGWIMLNETQFKRILRQAGISPKSPEGKDVSPLEERLIEIQKNQNVNYASALAGYSVGPAMIGGQRVLVTESPRIIEPLKGDHSTICYFIMGLLPPDDFNQWEYLCGWLKVAYEALRAGERRPGQALVLAGVHGCGKSLLQQLITLILGGRSARPYQFMTGRTEFNSDLFGAEHLMIEDDSASTDIRARRHVGAAIKNVTVNEGQRCHAKGRPGISLTPFWRLSISVNDEPENLMVLPPIEDSIEDKLIILKASKAEKMPMPTVTLEQRKAFWSKLEGELPAFVEFLTTWEIPENLLSDRFGITHFHHPEILRAIDGLAPEFRLMRLIDEEMFNSAAACAWMGSAEQLERALKATQAWFEVRRGGFLATGRLAAYIWGGWQRGTPSGSRAHTR